MVQLRIINSAGFFLHLSFTASQTVLLAVCHEAHFPASLAKLNAAKTAPGTRLAGHGFDVIAVKHK